jgi:hypothetical protein
MEKSFVGGLDEVSLTLEQFDALISRPAMFERNRARGPLLEGGAEVGTADVVGGAEFVGGSFEDDAVWSHKDPPNRFCVLFWLSMTGGVENQFDSTGDP